MSFGEFPRGSATTTAIVERGGDDRIFDQTIVDRAAEDRLEQFARMRFVFVIGDLQQHEPGGREWQRSAKPR